MTMRGTLADALSGIICAVESNVVPDGEWSVGTGHGWDGKARCSVYVSFDERYELPDVPRRCLCENVIEDWDSNHCRVCLTEAAEARCEGER